MNKKIDLEAGGCSCKIVGGYVKLGSPSRLVGRVEQLDLVIYVNQE